MTDLLDLLSFQSTFTWWLIGITLVAIIGMPRLFGLNYLNGLLSAQITLFFNAATIIAGLDSRAVTAGRGLNFYIIEFSFFALTLAAYRFMLRHRELVLTFLKRVCAGNRATYITVLAAGIAVFNFLVAPTDGTSRIAYMTQAWFSLIKPLIQLITPLSYLTVCIMLVEKSRRYLGYTLLGVLVLANIATGSKASFALSLFAAFLALRDLSGYRGLRIRLRDVVSLSLFIGAAVVFALTRLEVSGADLANRFFLYGEATILTYFSDTPTAACSSVSTFASMHRGWARLLGDRSAQDIDTLFGYALNIEHVGVNTFTGPNARLSAYFLCNFPGEKMVFGLFMLLVYLLLLMLLFRRLLIRPAYLALVYPFLVVSLSGAAQDFNLIMQDVTMFVLLLLLTTCVRIQPMRHQFG